jgi:hypothetical protein
VTNAVLRCAAIVAVASLAAVPVAAGQQASSASPKATVALTIVGLASIQPADNTYVGPEGPYLDQGLGGVGFGAAAAVAFVSAGRFCAALEGSTASLTANQKGRLVGGSAEGQLRDTLVSTLVGVATASRAFQVVGGISWLVGTPSLNGVAITEPDSTHLAFTIGFDAAHAMSARTALVADVRYSIASRSERAVQIGVGRHIVRAGIGIRVDLN